MSRLPRMAGKKVIAALEKAGFLVARTKGAHHFLRHTDGRTTVVPVHSGEVIRPTLLTKILRDADLKREDSLRLL
ncbi:MAG: type II toxin-antitoxin system HicA family toxin [Rhodothermia bacterium]|nr:MAG: type II toxin-antitoxin system HicA family toxin [Rhodothermia bacterium]